MYTYLFEIYVYASRVKFVELKTKKFKIISTKKLLEYFLNLHAARSHIHLLLTCPAAWSFWLGPIRTVMEEPRHRLRPSKGPGLSAGYGMTGLFPKGFTGWLVHPNCLATTTL